MQIVIDIPEEVLNSIKTFKGKFICKNGYDLIKGTKNSTPLPKGHGRLFDERDIVNGNYEVIGNRIYELEPILEADRSEK